MELKKATLEKIKKVNKAKNDGYDDSWIVKNLFNRNQKRYSEWITKFNSHLISPHEVIGEVEIIKEIPIEKPTVPNKNIELINSPEEYKAFKELMKLFMEGKIQTKGSSEITEKIIITKDTFKGHEIIQKTMRVSKELYDDLGTFAKSEGLTKVDALNFAIKELLDKYN